MSSDSTQLILSVSSILKNLLQTRTGLDPTEIYFESPADFDNLPDSGISIFLWKISENPFLKNQDHIRDFVDNEAVLYKPPLGLDLYYLIVPYGETTKKLILIEEILSLFYDIAVLDETILTNDLIDSGNNSLKIFQTEMSIEQMNNLWNLFPTTNYSISLSYLVTPLLIPSRYHETFSRILSKDIHFYSPKKK